jgi:hypothetical protein
LIPIWNAIERRLLYIDNNSVFSRCQIQFVAGMYSSALRFFKRADSDKHLIEKRLTSNTRNAQLPEVRAATFPVVAGVNNQAMHAKTANTKLADATEAAATAHKSMECYTYLYLISATVEFS